MQTSAIFLFGLFYCCCCSTHEVEFFMNRNRTLSSLSLAIVFVNILFYIIWMSSFYPFIFVENFLVYKIYTVNFAPKQSVNDLKFTMAVLDGGLLFVCLFFTSSLFVGPKVVFTVNEAFYFQNFRTFYPFSVYYFHRPSIVKA